jgi:hypothetical protein
MSRTDTATGLTSGFEAEWSTVTECLAPEGASSAGGALLPVSGGEAED